MRTSLSLLGFTASSLFLAMSWAGSDAADGCARPCSRCKGCACAPHCSGSMPCTCAASSSLRVVSGTSAALDAIPNPHNSALVRLVVPQDAVVFVNGKVTESKTMARSFRSEIIPTGGVAVFELKATIRRRGKALVSRIERKVLNAGETYDLRFTETDFKVNPVIKGLAADDDTGRSHSDGITNKRTLTFHGTGHPRDHIRLLDGVYEHGDTVVDSDGTWTISSNTSLNERTYWFKAQSSDPHYAIDVRESELFRVIVDATVPWVPSAPALDPASDAGDSDSDRRTNVSTPTVTGSGAEPDSDIQIVSDGEIVGKGRADATGNWVVELDVPLRNGDRSLRARGVDAAGNTSGISSDRLLIHVRATTIQPPFGLGVAPGGPWAKNQIAEDAFPDFMVHGLCRPGLRVELYIEDQTEPVGQATADSLGKWLARVTTPLAPGKYRFHAIAKDGVGNASQPSMELVATVVDAVVARQPGSPRLDALSDTGASNADGITNNRKPTLNVVADPNSLVELFFEGDTAVIASGWANKSGLCQLNISDALPEGTHRIVARATRDKKTSITSSALEFKVDVTPPQRPSAPELESDSDSGSSSSDQITRGTLPVFSGTAEPGSIVELLSAAVAQPIGRTECDANGEWQIVVRTPLGAGMHSITARATDIASNVSELSAPTLLNIVTTPPPVPRAPSIAADGTRVGSLTGDAEPGTTIELYDEAGTKLLDYGRTSSTGRWKITLRRPLTSGVYILTATRVDQAGNTSVSAQTKFRQP
jgi:uncharacterized protein (TIGR03000 family)